MQFWCIYWGKRVYFLSYCTGRNEIWVNKRTSGYICGRLLKGNQATQPIFEDGWIGYWCDGDYNRYGAVTGVLDLRKCQLADNNFLPVLQEKKEQSLINHTIMN